MQAPSGTAVCVKEREVGGEGGKTQRERDDGRGGGTWKQNADYNDAIISLKNTSLTH